MASLAVSGSSKSNALTDRSLVWSAGPSILRGTQRGRGRACARGDRSRGRDAARLQSKRRRQSRRPRMQRPSPFAWCGRRRAHGMGRPVERRAHHALKDSPCPHDVAAALAGLRPPPLLLLAPPLLRGRLFPHGRKGYGCAPAWRVRRGDGMQWAAATGVLMRGRRSGLSGTPLAPATRGATFATIPVRAPPGAALAGGPPKRARTHLTEAVAVLPWDRSPARPPEHDRDAMGEIGSGSGGASTRLNNCVQKPLCRHFQLGAAWTGEAQVCRRRGEAAGQRPQGQCCCAHTHSFNPIDVHNHARNAARIFLPLPPFPGRRPRPTGAPGCPARPSITPGVVLLTAAARSCGGAVSRRARYRCAPPPPPAHGAGHHAGLHASGVRGSARANQTRSRSSPPLRQAAAQRPRCLRASGCTGTLRDPSGAAAPGTRSRSGRASGRPQGGPRSSEPPWRPQRRRAESRRWSIRLSAPARACWR
jgi:hypothetical protein